MKSSVVVPSLVLLLAFTACNRQSAPDNSAERKERIIANLREAVPPLKDLDVKLGDIVKSPIAGMQETEMTVSTPRGPQRDKLLVSADDKAVYIVMIGPVDATKSLAAIKSEQKKKNEERDQQIAKGIAGLPVRGNPVASVTLVEFSDFQCPYCKRAAEAVEQVLQQNGSQVKFVFVSFPLEFHPWAKPASIAATCAAQQSPEAFWKMHDSFFREQESMTPENVLDKSESFAAAGGLDVAKWKDCARNDESAAHKSAVQSVEAGLALGQQVGVTATPSFILDGELIEGLPPAEEISRQIREKTGAK